MLLLLSTLLMVAPDDVARVELVWRAGEEVRLRVVSPDDARFEHLSARVS